MAHGKKARHLLKRKTRDIQGKSLGKFLNSLIAIYVSHYSTGDLLQSQDSSLGSNSEGNSNSGSDNGSSSEIESEFDDRLAQKKQKIDDPLA